MCTQKINSKTYFLLKTKHLIYILNYRSLIKNYKTVTGKTTLATLQKHPPHPAQPPLPKIF